MEKHAKDISEIIKAMDYLIPERPALDGEAPLSENETFLLLLPRLNRLRKRGVDLQELVDFLTAMGLPMKARHLRRHLDEYQAVRKKILARQAEREAASNALPGKRKSGKKNVVNGLVTAYGNEPETIDRPSPETMKTEAEHA